MAERRMFAIKITGTAEFHSMTPSAQALYYSLIGCANNAGVIYDVALSARQYQHSRKVCGELVEKGYIIPLSETKRGIGAAVITHWYIHNKPRANTVRQVVYGDVTLCEINGAYVHPSTDAVNILTPLKIAKSDDSCEQDVPNSNSNIIYNNNIIDSNSNIYTNAPAPVKITVESYKALCDEFGQDNVELYIQDCANYCNRTGKRYGDYAGTIRAWMLKNSVTKPSDSESDFAGEPLDLDDYRQFINNFD